MFESEVERIFLQFRLDYVVNWDGILFQVLIYFRVILVPLITYICILGLITDIFLSAFKEAQYTSVGTEAMSCQ